MKLNLKFLYMLPFALLLSACGPSQKITNSWISPEAGTKGPYKSIFIMVLSQSTTISYSIEDRMATTLAERGQKAVLSSAVFPPNTKISDNFTREQMTAAIKKTGCDAVFVLSALDVQSVETYNPGTSYRPMNYGYYGSYYGYYNHYYPQVYSPGYYSTDKTYFIETNFYDLRDDKLLWSIQSEAYNPNNIDSWFDTYAYDLLNELKVEDLIQGEGGSKPAKKKLH